MNNRITVPRRKRKGEDGYKVTSIRLPEDLMNRLTDLANKTEYSRNEIIVMLLSKAIDMVEIEDN